MSIHAKLGIIGMLVACAVPAMAEDLTMAVTPAGGGVTVPAEGGPYTYTLNEAVSITATPNTGYRFVQWTVSAGAAVTDPVAASTTVTMDLTKTVTAVFEAIELRMAADPGSGGTTVPAVGGPYPKTLNEVVSISATANVGHRFAYWRVSAGSPVADPNAASTSVTMDQAKTVTAVFYPILLDTFDSYTSGAMLSTQGTPPPWVLDGCNDGKVNNGNASSAPNSIADYKNGLNQRIGIRNRHDLTAAEMTAAQVVHDPNPNCINGTDANPLEFGYTIYLGPKTTNVYYYKLNIYAELSCGADRAPTPMLMADCAGKIRPHLNLDGDGQVHKSIAIGQIAWADPDPCDILTSQVAQNYRLTLYDGRQWRILQNPVDVHPCGGYNWVTLTVRTNTIEVSLETSYDVATGTCSGSKFTYTTTVDRAYTGDFNSVKFGGIPKDPADGTGCWGEDNAPSGAYPAQGTFIDDVYLQGGEASHKPEACPIGGACCLPGPTLGCVEQTTESVCTGLGGTWKGANTTCSDPTINNCCPTPFADIDDDDDVDQADFAYFQECITGSGLFTLEGVCKCFDVTDSSGGGPDTAVDDNDLGRFELCVSGPGIPLDPACD